MNFELSLGDLNEILERVDTASVVTDKDKKIIWINDLVTKNFGYQLDDLQNTSIENLIGDKFLHKFGFPIRVEANRIALKNGLTLIVLQNLEVEEKLNKQIQKQAILLDAITHAQLDFIAKNKAQNYEAIFSPLLKAITLVSECEFGVLYLVQNGQLNLFSQSEDLHEFPLNQDPALRTLDSQEIVFCQIHEKVESNNLYNVMAIPLQEQQFVIAVLVLYNQKDGFTPYYALDILPATQSIVQLLCYMEQEKSERQKTLDLIAHEKKTRQLYKQLEKQNHDLELAKRKAEESKQIQTYFLANISHEIRTPLNGIMGLTELLLNMTLDEKALRYAKLVYQSSEVLLSLINDLLDLTKIEEGLFIIENVPCDICAIIQEVIHLLVPKALQKGLTVNFNYSPTCPRNFETDPIRIRQLVMNLISNAIKFTDKGSIFISCQEIEQEDESISLAVSVTDTGVGIPEEKNSEIFQKFHQLDRSTTRKYSGTGLGLSICKKIVEKMSGKIFFESQFGQGSKFTFQIPLNCPSRGLDDDLELEKIPILLIAEDSVDLSVCVSYLKKFKMNLISNSSIEEGIQTLKQAKYLQTPIKIIIYDVQKLNMNRFETLIKESSMDNTPIICSTWDVSSDNNLDQMKQSCLFISKPISSMDVALAIKKGLKHEKL